MGKRQVTILEPASDSVAEAAWFIESKGMVDTARKFVEDTFNFFSRLADERIEHHPWLIPSGRV